MSMVCRRRLFGAVLFVLVCLLPALAARAEDKPFSFAEFDKLSKDDKLAGVLAKLTIHEQALANMQVSVKQTYSIFESPGKRGRTENMSLTLMTIGEKYFCQSGRKLAGSPGPDGDFDSTSKLAWDGKIGLVWQSHKVPKIISGVISPSEDGTALAGIGAIHLTNQLGLRRAAAATDGLTASIERCIKQGHFDWDIGHGAGGEKDWVRLAVTDPKTKVGDEYLIDPQRQFIIRRCTRLIPGKAHPVLKNAEAITDEIKEIAGVAVPWRITYSEFVPSKFGPFAEGEKTVERIYQMTDCKLGAVKESDFTFDFPAGTSVVDQLRRIAYQIQPDGTHKPLEYHDITGGKPSTRTTTAPAVRP